jgi:hypothetical protein
MFLFSFKYFSSKVMEVKLNISPCNYCIFRVPRQERAKSEPDVGKLIEKLESKLDER